MVKTIVKDILDIKKRIKQIIKTILCCKNIKLLSSVSFGCKSFSTSSIKIIASTNTKPKLKQFSFAFNSFHQLKKYLLLH